MAGKAKAVAKPSAKSADKEGSGFVLDRMKRKTLMVTIEGISPLCTHKWDSKAIIMIADKQAGAGKQVREKRDPRAEWEAAFHRDPKTGVPVLPVSMFKKSLINAAHTNLGIAKTVVSGACYFRGDVASGYTEIQGEVLPFEHPETCKTVRLGGMSNPADLRYRPMWPEGWKCTMYIDFFENMITIDQILNLLEKAGFTLGVAEGRPQKQSGLDWGRFQVLHEEAVVIPTISKKSA